MKIKVRRDLTSGIVLMILCIVLWSMIPYQIIATKGGNNAQMFPRIILGTMFVLAFFITIKSIITKNDLVLEFDLKKEGKILLYIISLVLYVFLIDKVGYLIATFVISGITLAIYRAKRIIYVSMAVFIVVVYFLFKLALNVPLP
ncbi:hypothetical protein SH2C18_15460 [Clostridium sediminicola]|uniref:tripartite tricarboxylate transporter TctB family protein n=1 Tax=Clostridium sediminicola TaxID=3114879 RepID=UPI0031F21C38